MSWIHILRPRLVLPAHSLAMAIRLCLAVCCLAVLPAECAAYSTIPPGDLTATSPGGLFKADATVAANGCRIEVHSMPAGILLWSAEHEGFLAELMLTDAGGLLTRDYPVLSYIYYSAAGKPGPRFELGTEIPPDERKRFCGEMSWWEQQIYNYLVRDIHVEGTRAWIYFRTYWGRIVTMDCATGALDRDPALAKRIEDALLAEAETWIASSPVTFTGSPGTLAPFLEDKVALNLFVIRRHRLKAGEPYIASALKNLRGEHIMNMKYCLNEVYDPSTLSARLKENLFLIVPLVLTGIIGIALLLRRKAASRQQARVHA